MAVVGGWGRVIHANDVSGFPQIEAAGTILGIGEWRASREESQ